MSVEKWSNPFTQGTKSRRGTQIDSEFYQSLMKLGDMRLLLPSGQGAATLTDKSRHAEVVTWSEASSAFDTIPAKFGSGWATILNGTDEDGDIPDSSNMSLGDSQSDEACTIFGLIYIDDETPTAINTVIGRWNKDSDGELREWRMYFSATNGYLTVEFYDESANAYIGRQYQTAITVSSWTLIAASYDGSGSSNGITLWVDGAKVTVVDSESGTYVAMENLASTTQIGHELSAAATPVPELWFAGRIAILGVYGKDFNADEHWTLKENLNGYYLPSANL